MKHVFIVGSKGIPAHYGGFETFVDKLTEYHQHEPELKYHVACRSLDSNDSFEYHNADCFRVKVPNIGAAQAIYYDIKSLYRVCDYIEENHISAPIVYILTCRIGLFAPYFQKRIHRAGGKVYLNPDGHEWKRSKWPLPVRLYWRFSEAVMVRSADLLICDSVNIESYIQKTYHKTEGKTTYIAYGAETEPVDDKETDNKLGSWLEENNLTKGGYYLSVGRFVPENNYETMIREFMASDSEKDYVIITTPDDSFQQKLEETLHYSQDPRIKFPGSVYDQKLLQRIREEAYGYIHGHEVGGTNPSLLEALGSTKVNLLYNVCFNSEVGGEGALYWSKERDCLKQLVESVDQFSEAEREEYANVAKKRIDDCFRWDYIANLYKELFCD